jgi:hypothetical protein
VEFVTVKTPDGSGKLELIKFHRPTDEEGAHPAPANRLGIRHVALVVDDLDTIVKGLGTRAWKRSERSRTTRTSSCSVTSAVLKGSSARRADRLPGPSTEP